MYKLTITKVINRVSFMAAMRRLCNDLSIKDVALVSNCIPYTFDNIFNDPGEIKEILGATCEYTYQGFIPYVENDYLLPWQTKEYVDAKNWYLTLPKDDRDKIDILVKANVIYG